MKRDLSTYTDKDILNVIVQHTHLHHGLTPTRRQLIELLDLTALTTSAITYRLERMVENGLLFWNGEGGARRIGVVGGYWVYYPWLKIVDGLDTHTEQMEFFARSATPLGAIPLVFDYLDRVEGRDGAVWVIDLMLKKILGTRENYQRVIDAYEHDTGKSWSPLPPHVREGSESPLPNLDWILD